MDERIVPDRDSLHRFVFDDLSISGKLVHLDASWRAILDRAEYAPAVRQALGQAMVASALLASTIKFQGRLTFQIQGDGPLRLLVVQCTDRLTLRGLARAHSEATAGSLRELTGDGRLTVTIDSKTETHRYQGIVPLRGETVADCLQAYFEDSEQLPTRLWIAATDDTAAGMLLQRVPERGLTTDEDAWPRLVTLANTLTESELFQLSDRALLTRLFHEEDIRLFEASPVAFRCECSSERVISVLQALGQAEIASIVEERGSVEVRCEFCNRAYVFDPIEAAYLFSDRDFPRPPRANH